MTENVLGIVKSGIYQEFCECQTYVARYHLEFYSDCTDLTFYVNIIQLLSIWLFCFINKSNMHQSYPKAYSISNVTLEFMVDRRRMLK